MVKVHSGVAADGQSTMPKGVLHVKLIEPPCTERWCERSDIGNILFANTGQAVSIFAAIGFLAEFKYGLGGNSILRKVYK